MRHLRLICVALLSLTVAAAPADPRWVGSWAASQQGPEERNALPDAELENATLRQLVRLSIGGKRVRVLLSNAFGREPLVVDAAHIARTVGAIGGSIEAASDRALTFAGETSVTIPAGASYWSDPVAFDAAPLSSVAVTLHLPHAPKGQTSHPGSRAISYVAQGNQVAAEALRDAKPVDHWYQLAGISVEADAKAQAVVTLGDSITDGRGSTTNGNNRWPDQLADRLRASAATRSIGVLNHGVGGNRLLNDGLGPNAVARFDRDVLAQPGVRYLIVLEGINDIGTLAGAAPASPEAHAGLVARMIGAYRQIIGRARAAGIEVYGATILPFGGSDYDKKDPRNEADRQAVNAWIRTPGNFDAVIDFDRVTRDAADPRRLSSAYDSGDGLHPSVKGYQAMATTVPLELFK